MKRKFEEPEMQVIVFGSEDTMCTTSSISLKSIYGGTDGGQLYVFESDDK